MVESTQFSAQFVRACLPVFMLPPSMLASKVGSYPNIHEIPGAGVAVAQTLPELQGFALHMPDQVVFQEQTTLPHH